MNMRKSTTWIKLIAGRSLLYRTSLHQSRMFSLGGTKVINVSQGGQLTLNLGALSTSRVVVSSKWQDHVEVSCMEANCDLSVTEDKGANAVQVTALPSNKEPNSCPFIEVVVPEYLDITIDAQDIDLSLLNKLQGDMSIKCLSGTIVADKLRGSYLEFDCGTADLTIRKLMEGSSNIQCRALKAKMINGDSVNVSAEHVSVDVIYGEQTAITARDDITVGLMKGSIEAHSEGGNISVSGIDGSFDVHAERGSIRLQINKLYEASDSALATEHMGAGGSHATAPEGHIVAVVDPELAATIYCESESAGQERVCTTVNSDAFELEPDLENDVRTPRAGTWEGGVIKGFLTGKSAGVKRPTFSRGTSQSGKIDLAGAEAQAQQMGGSSQNDTTANADAIDMNAGELEEPGYDINLFARGNVRIDTMSWIQIIRSKYGFEDNVSADKAPTPGRTASANANAAKVANSVHFDDKAV